MSLDTTGFLNSVQNIISPYHQNWKKQKRSLVFFIQDCCKIAFEKKSNAKQKEVLDTFLKTSFFKCVIFTYCIVNFPSSPSKIGRNSIYCSNNLNWKNHHQEMKVHLDTEREFLWSLLVFIPLIFFVKSIWKVFM